MSQIQRRIRGYRSTGCPRGDCRSRSRIMRCVVSRSVSGVRGCRSADFQKTLVSHRFAIETALFPILNQYLPR